MIQSIATFTNIRGVNQLNIFMSGKIAFTRLGKLNDINYLTYVSKSMPKLKSLLLSQRTNKLCRKFCLPLNPEKYISALVVDIQRF